MTTGKTLTHVLITHGHADHYIGAGVLRDEFPQTDFVVARHKKGGRPPFDPVMMFKVLIIQAQNNRAEFLISDRLSFMRFLGLDLQDRVPDAKTICRRRGHIDNDFGHRRAIIQ